MEKTEIEDKIRKLLAENLSVPVDQVTLESRFQEDLDADSLDLVEAVLALEEEFGVTIPEEEMESIRTVGQAVTRKVDITGSICFAGTSYRVGNSHRRRQVQVAIVGDVVEISSGGEVLRTHPIRHDRSRENGAFANPGGRPHRINAA